MAFSLQVELHFKINDTDKTNVIDFSMIGAKTKVTMSSSCELEKMTCGFPLTRYEKITKVFTNIETFKESPTKLKRVLYNKALVK